MRLDEFLKMPPTRLMTNRLCVLRFIWHPFWPLLLPASQAMARPVAQVLWISSPTRVAPTRVAPALASLALDDR